MIETHSIQEIIHRSSHCMTQSADGEFHSAVKAKISDLRLVELHIASLEADARRLDAIERNNWMVGKTPTGQWSVIAHQVSRIAMKPGLRATIDAAISQEVIVAKMETK